MIHSSSDNYAPITEAEQRALRTHIAAKKLLNATGANWAINVPGKTETPRAPEPSAYTPSRAEAELNAYMQEIRKNLPIRY